MKNLLLIPAMVIALTSVNATELPSLNVVKDKTFVLNINDWNKYDLKISFLTTEGIEIYSEIIQSMDRQEKEYNLQILRKGSYQVIVSNGKRSIIYDIVIEENSIANISNNIERNTSRAISKDIMSKIKFIKQLNQENSLL